MKIAKASEVDLLMATDLCGMLEALGHRFSPAMPTKVAVSAAHEWFNKHNDEQCGRALRALLETSQRGSLIRVVSGCAAMLHPEKMCVDPEADVIEHHPDALAGLAARHARPLSEWADDLGDVLWWRFPIDEAPYCGSPICDDWPGYHTHWTPLILPREPAVAASTAADAAGTAEMRPARDSWVGKIPPEESDEDFETRIAAMDAKPHGSSPQTTAAKAAAPGEVVASYRRSDGRREWVSAGAWLYPGDSLVVLRSAPPSVAAG